MRLIVTLVDAAAGQRVLETMLAQGLPAVLVWTDAGILTGGRATLMIGAHDHDVADVCASLVALGAVTSATTQTLLPLTDPTDLHVGRPPLPGISEFGLYVLRVSRFEQIW
ncbi:MAG: cyclic-di-AMP receptor [Ilumatobacter sp.]